MPSAAAHAMKTTRRESTATPARTVATAIGRGIARTTKKLGKRRAAFLRKELKKASGREKQRIERELGISTAEVMGRSGK